MTVTVAVTEVVVSKSGAAAKLITPLASITRSRLDISKVNVSLASTSVAVIVAFGIAVSFSAIVNSVSLEVIVGASLTSVTVIVMS